MNYLLFNKHVFYSDGIEVKILEKMSAENLSSMSETKICMLDVDLLISSAVEEPIEKKDSILVRKFKELYPQEDYLIQDEKIGHNLFQLMAIKEKNIREIYNLIPVSKIKALVPYGIALRQCLMDHQIDLNQTIVFVEEQNEERFLTVMDGLMFSRTRIIDSREEIFSEIRRSQIDFFKKNEEFLNKKNSGIIIVTNSRSLSLEILKKQKETPVQYLEIQYPALEGLKNVETDIKYSLPEEIIQQRTAVELRNKINVFSFSLTILALSFFYLVFNQCQCLFDSSSYQRAIKTKNQLEHELVLLDQEIYRDDLKHHQMLNYGVCYLRILNLIPSSYAVESFNFEKSKHWKVELSLKVDDQGSYETIPHIAILRYADIKDTFINNQAGKSIKIII